MKHDAAKADKDQHCKVKKGQQYNIITAFITEILVANHKQAQQGLVHWLTEHDLKTLTLTTETIGTMLEQYSEQTSHGCSIIKLRLADCFILGFHTIVINLLIIY